MTHPTDARLPTRGELEEWQARRIGLDDAWGRVNAGEMDPAEAERLTDEFYLEVGDILPALLAAAERALELEHEVRRRKALQPIDEHGSPITQAAVNCLLGSIQKREGERDAALERCRQLEAQVRELEYLDPDDRLEFIGSRAELQQAYDAQAKLAEDRRLYISELQGHLEKERKRCRQLEAERDRAVAAERERCRSILNACRRHDSDGKACIDLAAVAAVRDGQTAEQLLAELEGEESGSGE